MAERRVRFELRDSDVRTRGQESGEDVSENKFEWTDEQRAQLVIGSTVDTIYGRKRVNVAPYPGSRVPWRFAYHREINEFCDLSMADPSTIGPPVAHAPAASEAGLAERLTGLVVRWRYREKLLVVSPQRDMQQDCIDELEALLGGSDADG